LSKNKLSLVILLVVIIALGGYVYKHAAEFAIITQVTPRFLLPLVVIALFLLTLNGILTKLFVGLFGTELSPREWFGLAMITAMGNYLAPFRGGAVGKAMYLKKKHRFPYTTFLTTYTASYLLTFLVGGLLGLLTVGLFYMVYKLFDWRLFSFFLVVSVVGVMVLKLSDYTPRGTGRLSQRWRDMGQGWQRIKGNRAFVIKIVLVLSIHYAAMSLILYYGYQAVSQEIPYLAACFMAIILALSIFISLTPGNLGIQESIIALLSKLFGLGFNEGLLVAGLLRVVLICIVFGLGPVFSYVLTRSLPAE
jgi:uncharacterized protein (TIRG00374 family)